MITGIKTIKVAIIAINAVLRLLPRKIWEITKAATPKAIPTP
jgi:hypothetical protein